MQIQDALLKFTVQLEADGRSPHTIRQYSRHVRALARWLDDTARDGHVEALDHEDVAAFLASPEARRRPDGGLKKAGSMNSLRGSLKGFFGYLHRAGAIPTDPTRLVRRALCGRPLPRTIPEADQKKLLAAIDHPRDHLLFHLMLRTGIRLGSALALDVSDLDLERGEIVLRHAKGDREERVYLPKGIRGEVATFLRRMGSGPVFRGRGE